MRIGHLKPMGQRAREPYRTVPIPRGSLLRCFLLSALLAAVLIAIAFAIGGCDDNGEQGVRRAPCPEAVGRTHTGCRPAPIPIRRRP